MSRFHVCVTLGLLFVLTAGCGEPECPPGHTKRGSACYRIDAGLETDADASVQVGDDADTRDSANGSFTDGGPEQTSLPSLDAASVGDAGAQEASTDANGADTSAGPSNDASLADVIIPADTAVPDANSGDVCAPSPCQHGGSCSRTAQGAACDCAGTGYQGSRCENDIDECAGPHVCTNPEYPCVQTEPPGYTCEGQMADWPMPDAVLSANVRPSYDTTSVPGVVIDKVTGLAWQREPPAVYERCTGNIEVAGDSCTWEEAKNYCTRLELGGSDDWRLPSKIELESIFDDTRAQAPAINTEVFGGTRGPVYWSASTYADPAGAWATVLTFGTSSPQGKTRSQHVRCVRVVHRKSGTPDKRYTISGGSLYPYVVDSKTGLVWQQVPDATARTFEEARTHCASQGGMWRVPTKKELLTLVDLSQPPTEPTINAIRFPTTALSAFRTASSVAGTSLLGTVDFKNGSTLFGQNADLLPVRCVR